MKKKTNLTLKNMVTSISVRKKHTFWQKFLLQFRTPKGIKKTCPLVFLHIPIWRSYNAVLLHFFREMKDIPKMKHNY